MSRFAGHRRVFFIEEAIREDCAEPQLRVQVARRALDYGCLLSPDDIVTTTGCQEALNLCLRAVAGPGDTIAVESPTYYGILQMIGVYGRR